MEGKCHQDQLHTVPRKIKIATVKYVAIMQDIYSCVLHMFKSLTEHYNVQAYHYVHMEHSLATTSPATFKEQQTTQEVSNSSNLTSSEHTNIISLPLLKPTNSTKLSQEDSQCFQSNIIKRSIHAKLATTENNNHANLLLPLDKVDSDNVLLKDINDTDSSSTIQYYSQIAY